MLVFTQPVAVIVSVTVTLPFPTVFHLMVAELAQATIVPRFVTSYRYGGNVRVVYISSSVTDIVVPEISGSGRRLALQSVVCDFVITSGGGYVASIVRGCSGRGYVKTIFLLFH